MPDLHTERNTPVDVVVVNGESQFSCPFDSDDVGPDEGWRFVLDMADGVDPYMPVRCGATTLMLIAVPAVQWGHA
jgi:hypothetical protein